MVRIDGDIPFDLSVLRFFILCGCGSLYLFPHIIVEASLTMDKPDIDPWVYQNVIRSHCIPLFL